MLARMFARPAADLKERADRRGRAAVVWGLLLFAAMQIGFYPLANIWPQLGDRYYGRKLAHLRAQMAAKPKDQPCIVMLGSSLTGTALNPSAMTTLKPGSAGGPVVYNFGFDSGGPVVQLLCLRRLLADGIRPDLVLLETEPRFLIRSYNTVGGEHFLPTPRVQFQDVHVISRYDSKGHEFRMEWRDHLWLPWYYHRHDLTHHFLPKWAPRDEPVSYIGPPDRNGWEKVVAGWQCRHPPLAGEQLAANSQYYFNAITVSAIFPGASQAYREMVDLCSRSHVPVLFVRMPENSRMRAPPPDMRDKIESYFGDLSRDTGVASVDARDWVQDDAFLDGSHLAPAGAAAFSQRLARECVGPFMEKDAAARPSGNRDPAAPGGMATTTESTQGQ